MRGHLKQRERQISIAKTPTTIQGTLNSTPNKSFIVQFFSNASGDEGQKFIGQVGVTTDASGNATFTFKPAKKVGKGKITATATDTSAKNTSEFSAAKKVVRKRWQRRESSNENYKGAGASSPAPLTCPLGLPEFPRSH